MSVVAGCLTMNGVLLAADTRITYPKHPEPEIHVDNAIKIFPFAPGTAIGYVGDVEAASALLRHLILGRDRRKRTDPISLSQWIPRLLRAAYSRFPPNLRKDVTFMAASSVRGRPMVVEKARLAEILFDAVKDGLQFITGTLPFAILTSDSPFVLIPNTCSSFLYTLRNPVFEPAYIPTMSHVAIGSGRGVAEDVHRVHARILFESLSNPGLSAHWFRNAVSAFAERNNIKSVGGLYPIIRVSADAFEYIGQTTITHRQGTSEIEAHVTLSIENECWVQRNITNQKEIFLKYPWDVLKCPQRSVLFDDIDRRRWSQRLTENNGDPAKLEAS